MTRPEQLTDEEIQAINNEKLAKWAGFYCLEGIWTIYDRGVLEPTLPNFTEDLNACFKWLVPKLQEKGYTVDIFGFEHKSFAINICSVFPVDDTGFCQSVAEAKDDNPALALCKAIEQLIDKGEA